MLNASVTTLHIELTSRCTLACPRCARTLNPAELSIQDLPLEIIGRSINKHAFPKLKSVLLCGSYGDPIYHRQFHDVIAHLKSEKLGVRMDTNGSYRNKEWWERTGAILSRSD